jgi:hypothetical protein
MSEPTAYEQLIARKLEELIVPDNANAIWATIEQQLNIEMPTNGGSSAPGGFKPNLWIGGGFFTIIVAILMYVAISRQSLKNDRSKQEEPAIINQQASEDEIKDSLSAPRSTVILKGVPAASKSVLQSADGAKQSSTTVVDSIQSSPKVTADPVVQSVPVDTIPKQKKSRGVKGISDEDYRIVPSQKDPKE